MLEKYSCLSKYVIAMLVQATIINSIWCKINEKDVDIEHIVGKEKRNAIENREKRIYLNFVCMCVHVCGWERECVCVWCLCMKMSMCIFTSICKIQSLTCIQTWIPILLLLYWNDILYVSCPTSFQWSFNLSIPRLTLSYTLCK